MVWAALQHHVCARNGIGQRSDLNFLNSFDFVLGVKKTASVEVHGAGSANMSRWYTPKSLTQSYLLQTGSTGLERREGPVAWFARAMERSPAPALSQTGRQGRRIWQPATVSKKR